MLHLASHQINLKLPEIPCVHLPRWFSSSSESTSCCLNNNKTFEHLRYRMTNKISWLLLSTKCLIWLSRQPDFLNLIMTNLDVASKSGLRPWRESNPAHRLPFFPASTASIFLEAVERPTLPRRRGLLKGCGKPAMERKECRGLHSTEVAYLPLTQQPWVHSRPTLDVAQI